MRLQAQRINLSWRRDPLLIAIATASPNLSDPRRHIFQTSIVTLQRRNVKGILFKSGAVPAAVSQNNKLRATVLSNEWEGRTGKPEDLLLQNTLKVQE